MSNQDQNKPLQTEFNSKMEIVQCISNEWGENPSSFYNSKTNKSVEKFWTYNRCLQYLFKLRRDYIRTKYGRTHKDFAYLLND
jgi:hypothetical protein